MRRLALPLTVAALALAGLAVAPAASAAGPNYLKLAKQGIRAAKANYWNRGLHWYNDRLNDNDPFPLATTWSIVPLFEAVDGVGLANKNKNTRKAVKTFAEFALHYWNPDLKPHGGFAPYPGDRGSNNFVYFDDNGWWGLALIDAYRVTHNKKYRKYAAKASNFADARAWQGGGPEGGMWWNTHKNVHSLEALAAETALAAEVYEYSGDTKYLNRARKFLAWADQNARDQQGLYENRTQPVMTYVEGAFLAADLALCQKGEKTACSQAELIARFSYDHWNGGDPNFGPQFDTIFFRYLVQLSAFDHSPLWWNWASRAAQDAIANAHDTKHPDLYLKFWDGTQVTAPQHQVLQMRYGQIQTHSAPVALFAWLAAFPAP